MWASPFVSLVDCQGSPQPLQPLCVLGRDHWVVLLCEEKGVGRHNASMSQCSNVSMSLQPLASQGGVLGGTGFVRENASGFSLQ